ncbi:Biopolymer transport protein ExbD [Burkholderiales bacterium]|nr:MAG: biopolymer transporter ExbD [Burkholderiales bacterium]CAG1010872.1 Biopolymer transport protein ExbD [Burkholderiales bacterium]
MDFRGGRRREEPEINLIPMIDVLLVILIFLMITTTYQRFAELQITLPEAEAQPAKQQPKEVQVAVDASGKYLINRSLMNFTGVGPLAEALRAAAKGEADPVVVINADSQATHQSVINVMEAARVAGFVHITFATQTPTK